jgi:hypothetical protein
MSSVLYYSNFCENSKSILSSLAKSSVRNNLHFICIDKRIQKNNSIYIILENNQEILLPETIKAVPALLLINNNYKVLFGKDILNYLKPVEEAKTQKATNFNGEPSAFSINSPLSGIISDNYSYLDQDTDELSAKGTGGTRQMWNYAGIDFQETIDTPPDDFVPDKVNESNLKEYEDNRNKIK